MPRKARQRSESDIYHIVMRGINRQIIFEDEEDGTKFLRTIEQYKLLCGYDLYAYCLMSNHIHLLLKTGGEPLAQVMRRICGSYVYWYNRKYQRVGNLFQDRFKSEAVEDDGYFLTAIRYIHQNPIKAGIVKRLEQYRWSSYKEYLHKPQLVNTDFALKMFDNDPAKAMKQFAKFNHETSDDSCIDIEEGRSISDEEAKNIVIGVCQIKSPFDLQKLEASKRNQCLRELKELQKLSIRQIERVTGINRGIVFKA